MGLPTASRPLRADAERNRRRILAAAREVFARRGLEAGLDEIARHAGVGTATVYRRFPDKDELVAALFADRMEELTAAARDAIAHPDPWSGLVAMLEIAIGMQIEDRGLQDVMFFQGGRARFSHHRGAMDTLAKEIVDRAAADGSLRPDVEMTDLAAVHLMVFEMAAHTEAEPQAWRRYLRLLLDGLCTRRAGPTPLGPPAVRVETLVEACRR